VSQWFGFSHGYIDYLGLLSFCLLSYTAFQDLQVTRLLVVFFFIIHVVAVGFSYVIYLKNFNHHL